MDDLIPGGAEVGTEPSDYDPIQLQRGTDVEMEHTTDPLIAREIAMAHLKEDPLYYEKLQTIEKHESLSLRSFLRQVLQEIS